MRLKCGEMNPEQLWESTMDPDTRELIQLTTDNIQEVIDLYSIIMGNNSTARKQFISSHLDLFKASGEDSDDVEVE